MSYLNNTNTLDYINDHFKLPIYYNKDKLKLKQNIITDLELIETVDPSYNPIYDFYFNSDNSFSKTLHKQITEYYTTDILFLKEKQQLLQEYKPTENKYTKYSKNYQKILDLWNEIKTDTGFREKYYYMDWDMLEFLNRSELFLQIMSIYNMASPVISLFIPIIILIIPFLIIKMKGMDITVQEYIEVLKIVIQTNAIGKLFTTFDDVSINEKVYLVISAAFYLFSIYQNIMVCVRFHNNMIKIHDHFNEINTYLRCTINNMDNYLHYSQSLVSQNEFNEVLKEKRNQLNHFKNKIGTITEYKLTNYTKIQEIGAIMKYFYQLYEDKVVNETILFSFGFNGYIDCIEGLQKNIEERKVHPTNFINKKNQKHGNKKMFMKNSYYACLKDTTSVKNDIAFKKNIIITGPNASGKTTILKSTLINILFSQQFGYGFYDKASICPFEHIHCYLNIPDTSGRDSLFQAEARRCKEILDVIDDNKEDTHFCVFDELYSGTNPEEAVQSAKAFMEYIMKNKNVSCLLTTHFVKMCKKIKKNKDVINYHMDTLKENKRLHYTYKLLPGISEVKGGISVLQDMNYPKEIIENTQG
jgi:DNA mismatch repair ATPase MutS